jgi:hypothetical protein
LAATVRARATLAGSRGVIPQTAFQTSHACKGAVGARIISQVVVIARSLEDVSAFSA